MMAATRNGAAGAAMAGVRGRFGVAGWLAAVLLAIGCGGPAGAQTETAEKPIVEQITLEPEAADFGEVKANSVANMEMKLRNNSKKTITFGRVTSSCSSCSNATIETVPIAPGDAATLKVEFRAPAINGEQSKTVYVFVQGETGAPVKVPVKAKVIEGVEPGQHVPHAEPMPARMPISALVEPAEVDLGFLRPEETGTMEVKIKNTGAEPIRFNGRVTTNCSCATGEIEAKELPPGDTAILKVKMEAGPNVGLLRRELKVWTATAQSIAVPVQANVTRAVNAEPSFILMLGETHGLITLEAIDGKPFRVVKAGGKAPVLDGAVDSAATAVRHVVKWDMGDIPSDDVPAWFIIETDHPEAPLLDLRVIHRGLLKDANSPEPWTLSHDRLLLGRIKPGDTFERKVTLVKLMNDSLESIESPDDSFDAKIVKREATSRGMEYTIAITAKRGTTGSGTLVLRTGEPAHSSVIHLFGKVEAVQ